MLATCGQQASLRQSAFHGTRVVSSRHALPRRVATAHAHIVMAKQTVLVTGAGGRTGRLVFDKLRARPDQFVARGLVRTEESKAALGGGADVFVGDITAIDDAPLRAALRGCDALVIVTSATPRMKAPPAEGQRPEFEFPPGGLPERVDWYGQKAQIDAAKALGVRRVVVIGSRGGTDPANMLNRIGGNTNILVWKRMAEQYLVNSGLNYTIIRAGGLLDKEGGKRQLVIGADDEDLGVRSVPRADVAEMAVQALLCADAAGRSMDLVSREEGDGAPTTDFAPLFARARRGM